MEQPKEELIDKIINEKLKHDEFWRNPRNKKTRIVVEMLMRECYLTGFNSSTDKHETIIFQLSESLGKSAAKLDNLKKRTEILCDLITGSPPETPIKGEIESLAFELGMALRQTNK